MSTESPPGLIALFNLEFSTSSFCIVAADIMHFKSLKRAAWHKKKTLKHSHSHIFFFPFAFNSVNTSNIVDPRPYFPLHAELVRMHEKLSEERMPLQEAMQSLLNESDEMSCFAKQKKQQLHQHQQTSQDDRFGICFMCDAYICT